jgi:hypothetical protein
MRAPSYKSFAVVSPLKRITHHERLFFEEKERVTRPTTREEAMARVDVHALLTALPAHVSNGDDFGQLSECLLSLGKLFDRNIPEILNLEPAAALPAILVEVLASDSALTNHAAIMCCATFMAYPNVDITSMLDLGCSRTWSASRIATTNARRMPFGRWPR